MNRLRFSVPSICSDMGGQFSRLFQVHAFHVPKLGKECGAAGGPRGLHVAACPTRAHS